MASLTDISITSRRIVRYGIYIIILILIGRFVFNLGVGIYKKIVPPPKIPANCAFKKLPDISFPDKPKPENPNYTLELPEGSLPKLSETIEVYYMPTFQTDISKVDDAKKKAQKMGFNPDGKILVESIPNVYVFDKNNIPSKLTMNIITGIFSISYDIEKNPLIVRGAPLSSDQAISTVKSYLSTPDLLSDDIKDGNPTFQFLKTENNILVPAISLSEANAIKVNLFRKNYGKDGDIPSVTPDMPEGNIWFILGDKKEIVAGEYHYFPIDAEKQATYPVKTSEKAFEELKEGKAYFANLGENSSNIIIRRVYLSYYDAGQYTEYFQPVIVFQGDNDFYAYVPAILECQ
ncbi:hypothetical protein A2159_03565 [Candidatus Woesebacteria bacterium RBG_13_34_9]|uniref:Uncharacterized protein n=1 Tax=Candidatus Woesebacteria bacterium RBG_13_34_9 TaxID=1802477 RepID=A0A1F7X0Q1_9BACT|nr:MAG: hypothetical protein A2159_03565 [Candidatus Woesebacteria bacterium RBG_13_34_9]